MMKYIYYNKKRKLIGLSLIETIVSMWILGIVIVSMLSFIGASMSKQNQLKIQAMSLAKSELQEATLEAMNKKITATTRYTVLLLKSSYQTKADENNESDINSDPTEYENGFYTKYISNDDGQNWTKVDSTYLEINSNNEGYTRNKGGISFFKDEPNKDSNNFSRNSIPINDIELIKSYMNNIKNLFVDVSEAEVAKEKITTKQYPNIENIAIDDKIIKRYGHGIKCFVIKTTFGSNNSSKTTIPINVNIIWSSEKTKSGYNPLDIYALESQIMMIND